MDVFAGGESDTKNERPSLAASILGSFIRNERELRQRLDYIHFNPVQKGLVKCPESWRWSSYNNFALNQEVVKKCPMRVDYIHLPQSYRG